jgi:hypothetical protein
MTQDRNPVTVRNDQHYDTSTSQGHGRVLDHEGHEKTTKESLGYYVLASIFN